MEVFTAVKGSAAIKIAELSKTDKIIYLDPDIAVFNSLCHFKKDYLHVVRLHFGYSSAEILEIGKAAPWGDLITEPENQIYIKETGADRFNHRIQGLLRKLCLIRKG